MKATRWLPLLLLCLFVSPLLGQQVADTTFLHPFTSPHYSPVGSGPHIVIDQAHHNFHTANGRFLPFATLARYDGFVVDSLTVPISEESLQDVDILVIANALAEANVGNWNLPNLPAFTTEEIAALHHWVEEGGSLLLIADHMPFGAAMGDLARSFGFLFMNGFALTEGEQFDTFRSGEGLNFDHPIVCGWEPDYTIEFVVTFTGQAFLASDDVQPIMSFGSKTTQLFPDSAWVFNDNTLRISAEGWMQGGTVEVGKGRVAAFGEAAMFTAQLAGPERIPIGMNYPGAPDNVQFVRNVLAWLIVYYD